MHKKFVQVDLELMKERSLRRVKKNVEQDPRCEASDIAIQADVSPKATARYLHKLGYYGRAAGRKPFLRPANIKRRMIGFGTLWRGLRPFGTMSFSLMS